MLKVKTKQNNHKTKEDSQQGSKNQELGLVKRYRKTNIINTVGPKSPTGH